jgi:hypothetical protein
MKRPYLFFLLLSLLPIISHAAIKLIEPIELHKSYTFKPQQMREFKNPLPLKASVDCTLRTTNDAYLDIKIKAKSLSINQQRLNSPQELTMHAVNNSHYHIKAATKVKVAITNRGDSDFSVSCSL